MDVGEEDDEEEADEDGDSDSSDDSNGEDTGMPNGGAGASSSMRGRGGSSRPGKGARRNFFSDL